MWDSRPARKSNNPHCHQMAMSNVHLVVRIMC